jgi:hypothetical protein
MTKQAIVKVIIGRSELLNFMNQDIAAIPAKIDTGAYSSSVHASDVTLSDDGRQLSYNLLGGHPIYGKLATHVETTNFMVITVINSFGNRENRYLVTLEVKIREIIFTSDFTLADRTKMTYPILIGRKALSNRFLVDTVQSGVDEIKFKLMHNIEIPEDEEAKRK